MIRSFSDRTLCQATVYHRDTYRYTGRGLNGFEMHYRREQCKRKATHCGFCWQHAKHERPSKEAS